MMVGSFTFNNINSESFNLVCKSVKRTLLPARKVYRSEPPNASGVYDTPGIEYSARIIEMKIQYIGTSFEELRSRARTIAAWLSVEWANLIINDEPDKYYIARIDDEIVLDNLYEYGSANVTFICQPYALSVAWSSFSFNSGDLPNCVFTNNGTRKITYKSPPGSKFLIKVLGSWNALTLELNGYQIAHNIITSNKELIIDNIAMEAKLAEVNVFNDISGDIDNFLPLIPGSNTLVVSGDGVNITSVTVEFIELWI